MAAHLRRDPRSRLALAALIGLALLAGLAFAECRARLVDGTPRVVARLGPSALAALILWFAYAQYVRGFDTPFVRRPLPATYPLQPVVLATSPVVRALARPGGAVLELPIGLYRQTPEQRQLDPIILQTFYTPSLNAWAMYRSIFHWRPLLNGYSSYWPEALPSRMDVARRLPDASALETLRRTTGLDTIVLQSDLMPGAMPPWTPFLSGDDGERTLHVVATEGKQIVLVVADAR